MPRRDTRDMWTISPRPSGAWCHKTRDCDVYMFEVNIIETSGAVEGLSRRRGLGPQSTLFIRTPV